MKALTQCQLKELMPKSKEKLQSEVGVFWLMSKAIRMQVKPAETLDVQITSLMAKMPMSEWLRKKLDHLRVLNLKRMGQGK